MKKTCRINKCYIKHEGTHFMCGMHWRMVPPDIQQGIYDGYEQMNKGKGAAAFHQAITDAELVIAKKQNNQQLTGNLNAI